MNKVSLEAMDAEFLAEVLNGLLAPSKRLSSKYFYDAKGDALFQKIMKLDEYYLTNKELEIFESKKSEILQAMGRDQEFRIIELGAGDGSKTKILLKHLLDQEIDFTYSPVDISGNVLNILEDNLLTNLCGLKMESFQGDYFEALKGITRGSEKEIIFFLGSNIGNFVKGEAEVFLSQLRAFMRSGDLLFMGVDMKKDPSVILSAYNDTEGVTTEFNLNLLDRINRELGGNFNRDQFQHYPYYNPQNGECRSYLISKSNQVVTIGEHEIHFRAWEAIFMEVSKKYDSVQLRELANGSGFIPLASFLDEEKCFSNVLWQVP